MNQFGFVEWKLFLGSFFFLPRHSFSVHCSERIYTFFFLVGTAFDCLTSLRRVDSAKCLSEDVFRFLDFWFSSSQKRFGDFSLLLYSKVWEPLFVHYLVVESSFFVVVFCSVRVINSTVMTAASDIEKLSLLRFFQDTLSIEERKKKSSLSQKIQKGL